MARNQLRIANFFLIFGCITLCFGCRPSSESEQSKSPLTTLPAESAIKPTIEKSEAISTENNKNIVYKSAGKEVVTMPKSSKTQTPPPPATIPKVSLTDALRATCLVNVGDVLPDGKLVDAEGGNVNLQNQFGEKLTVVFFWEEGRSHRAQLVAGSALSDFQADITEPYAKKGVKVIGINVGDNPQSVHQELSKIGIQIPYYFDANKAYFETLAKSILPRVYLLDASGKILWFDTEYSQSTRRNLMQAVQVVLGEK
jgi:hypothetical protein